MPCCLLYCLACAYDRPGASATGDPDWIPSISIDEHEAPPWQDKHAATLDLAHEGGGFAPHRLANLGRPTSGDDDVDVVPVEGCSADVPLPGGAGQVLS